MGNYRRIEMFFHLLLLFCGGTALTSSTKEAIVIKAERHLPRDKRASAEECLLLKSNTTIDAIMTCTGTIIVIDQGNGTLDLSNATETQVKEIFYPTNGNERALRGSLRITNSMLTIIQFNISAEKKDIEILIENNDMLTNISAKIEIPWGAKGKIQVQGNRRLNAESLDQLKKDLEECLKNNPTRCEESSYVQDVGECILYGPLTSFTELEACIYVKGDLNIDSNTDVSSPIPKTLTNITRCLNIVESKLRSFDFLEKLKGNCFDVAKNSICIHPEFEDTINKNFRNTWIKNPHHCEAECSSSYLLSQKNPKCQTVMDTLTITGNGKDANVSHLEGIRTIRGRLIINNNHMENFDFFKSLIAVIGEGSTVNEPAIEVKLNKNMKTFSLPLVEDVYTNPPQKAFYFAENGQYKMDCEMKGNFEQKLLKRRVDIAECNPTAATTPRNVTSNQNKEMTTSAPNSSFTATGVSIGSISVLFTCRYLFLQ